MRKKRPSLRSTFERDQLVKQWTPLVGWIIRRVLDKHDRWYMDDAFQVGMVALVRAAELWDKSRGVKFNSYACWGIRRAILDARQESYASPIRLPRNISKRCLAAAERALHCLLISPRQVGYVAWWDVKHAEDWRSEHLQRALRHLPMRWREVLRRKFELGQSGRVIAAEMGITTRQSVESIQHRAIDKLKELLIQFRQDAHVR